MNSPSKVQPFPAESKVQPVLAESKIQPGTAGSPTASHPATTYPNNTLRVSALECTRGERRLFRDLTFELASGALLQVRGSNGSGKTSLLRIICGLSAPSLGEVSWNYTGIGTLGDDYSARLVYIGHLNGLKDELDALENLRLSAQIACLPADIESIGSALARFGLEAIAGLPCKLLSQGQRRRLALARLALGAARPLWILDEPFAALDTTGIDAMRQLLEEHLNRGGLAILTSHQEVTISAPVAQTIELDAAVDAAVDGAVDAAVDDPVSR